MATATVTEVLASANDILAQHLALITRVRDSQKSHRRKLRTLSSPPQSILKLPLIPSPKPSPPPSPPSSPLLVPRRRPPRADLPPPKRARAAHYENYVPEEETIRNDYSQRYVDGGEWPQNWVLGAEPERRFEEYPKQQRLLALKKASVTEYALPPMYLPSSKFDVIVLDPPLSSSFSWNTLQDLPLATLAADPSFVFLWVGSGAGDGLERGREVLAKWGYRRCEDVCWVKTNLESNRGPGTDPPTTSLLTRTKQHCLIGIRGTVRRSTDSWFVHCNVDTDVILWEGDPTDPTRKPPEMYTLIENFCLGLRRLELFARARSLRRGWVSVLAEGEETHVPTVQACTAEARLSPEQLDGGVNVLGQELGVDRVERWDQDKWEGRHARVAAERPRRRAHDTRYVPIQYTLSKPTLTAWLHRNVQSGGAVMGPGSGGGGPMGARGVMKAPHGRGPNNMMDMGMGMNSLGVGVGMGWPHMGMPMGMPGAAGMMGMIAPGFGAAGFDGWAVSVHGWLRWYVGEGGGMGDDGMVGDGVANMGGMTNMGMGNMGNMAMGNMGMGGMGMGMGGMGMGQQGGMGMGQQGGTGQWNGGYEGF
ncbi:MT-A70-domain-containing protein [Lactarius deliciosus]|nr:MT-A70-domain-containing protein [Lactarius deliciosus]